MYLIALLILIVAILPSFGFFSVQGVVLALGVFCFLMLMIVRNKTLRVDGRYRWLLVGLLGLLCTICWFGAFQSIQSAWLGMGLLGIYFLVIPLAWRAKKNIPAGVPYVVFCLLGLLLLISSPNPKIDTVVVLKEAPLAFLQGVNPYAMNFTQVYVEVKPDYYNYLPGSFVYLAPFVYLLGDHRYAILITQLVGGYFLYLIFKDKVSKRFVTGLLSLYFFVPATALVLESGYLDIVIFTFFLGYFYFSQLQKEKVSMWLLGMFYFIKQPPLLTFPLWWRSDRTAKLTWVNLFYIFTLLSVFVIIYAVWDAQAFLYDTIFGLAPSAITSPIALSMTLKTLMVKAWSWNVQMATSINLLLLMAVYILLILLKRPYGIKLILFFLAFNLFSYHAFLNSYYLVYLFLIYGIGHEQAATKRS